MCYFALHGNRHRTKAIDDKANLAKNVAISNIPGYKTVIYVLSILINIHHPTVRSMNVDSIQHIMASTSTA